MDRNLQVDELIIGAGLSGLMYGLSSIEDGVRVAITESHCKVGGYATDFMRNKGKYIFDCSQHKITGIGTNGNLRNALERVGVWDSLDFRFFDDLTTIVYKGQFRTLPVDGYLIKQSLLKWFPDQSKGIGILFDDIYTHGYQNYMFARMLLGEYQLNKDLLPESRKLSNITTKEYFRTLFTDVALVEMLSSIAIYLGAIANEANAMYFLHFLYAAFATGPSYMPATGQHLAEVLATVFKERGGKLFLNNPASKIELSGKQIVAVESKKRFFMTEKVVATCAPSVVINMVQQDLIPENFNKQLANLKIGWGHFCVYAVSNRAPEDLGVENSEYLLISDEGDDLNPEELTNGNYYNKLTLSVTNYHKMNPEGGYILQFIILDHESDWFTLPEDEYQKKKLRIQALLLERAYQTFPKLRTNLVFTESSTPRTNKRYTNSPEGSAFGFKGLPKDNIRFLYNPPLQGLKFVGGWSTGPGYETALCLGFTHATLEKRKRLEFHQNFQNLI